MDSQDNHLQSHGKTMKKGNKIRDINESNNEYLSKMNCYIRHQVSTQDMINKEQNEKE